LKPKPYTKEQSLNKAVVREIVSNYENKKLVKKTTLQNTTTVSQKYRKLLEDPKKKPKTDKILYSGSDGKKYSERQIGDRLRKAYEQTRFRRICECCGVSPADEHDHTISKKRCKQLHKTELIWDSGNWSDSCRKCHKIYESYKSGLFQTHKNVIERMLFIKKHDLEGFRLRLNYITDQNILDQICS